MKSGLHGLSREQLETIKRAQTKLAASTIEQEDPEKNRNNRDQHPTQSNMAQPSMAVNKSDTNLEDPAAALDKESESDNSFSKRKTVMVDKDANLNLKEERVDFSTESDKADKDVIIDTTENDEKNGE